MSGFARVTLIGNLGADPEVKFSPSGVAVAHLRVACTERVKGRGGDWEDRTEWVRVTVFGKTAESAAQYLQKGRQVYAEGRLQTQEWTDKEGVKRWSTEVVCNRLLFLVGGEKGGQKAAAPAPHVPDDQIPF